jgi:hypothetical protein
MHAPTGEAPKPNSPSAIELLIPSANLSSPQGIINLTAKDSGTASHRSVPLVLIVFHGNPRFFLAVVTFLTALFLMPKAARKGRLTLHRPRKSRPFAVGLSQRQDAWGGGLGNTRPAAVAIKTHIRPDSKRQYSCSIAPKGRHFLAGLSPALPDFYLNFYLTRNFTGRLAIDIWQLSAFLGDCLGTPKGNRTPVCAVRGRRPDR